MVRVFLLLGVCIVSAVAGHLVLKGELNREGVAQAPALTFLATLLRRPLVVLSISLFGLSALTWFFVLARVDLSFAYPLLSLAVVGVGLGSAVFLHEPLSAHRMIGTVLVAVGVWLVSRS